MEKYMGYSLETKDVRKFGADTLEITIYKPNGRVLAIATGVTKSATYRLVKSTVKEDIAKGAS